MKKNNLEDSIKFLENFSAISSYQVAVDVVLDELENLRDEVKALNEELKDTISEREEYYELKKFDPYEEYGVSESDFH